MRRILSNVVRRVAMPGLVAVLAAAALMVQAPTGAPAVDLPPTTPIVGPGLQLHYLPFGAEQFLATLKGQAASALNDDPVHLVGSIVSARNANTVVIDHWEDGYDADPIAGAGATTETLTMGAGQTQVLVNDIDLTKIGDLDPNGTGQPYYDGRDKIISTAPVVVTAGGWPSTIGSVHAGASAVPEVSRYGYEFVSPVGEDTPFRSGDPTGSPWEYTGLIVAAAQDGTSVTVAGGAPLTLDEGETALVDGGINVGDTISADKPVAVYLSTGDKGDAYEGRLFELTPTERWTDEYFSPVTSVNNSALVTRAFLYNHGAGAISVTYTQSNGTTGTISVPAGGQANYKFPSDVGARFSSPGNPFYALQAITTPESGSGNDQSLSYNWGFSLIPTQYLTPMVVLGYAPGSSDLSRNYSAVWVAPRAATTIYVDRDGNAATGALTDANGNKYDFSCAASALSPLLIKDDGGSTCSTASAYGSGKGTGDADMTGARIYTLDGTALAAAWGQVPGLQAGNPAIDMGTTVLPFPTVDLTKTSDIVDDDGDGLADPGETIRYTITANNTGITPVDALVMTDDVPEHTTYTAGTTQTNGNPIADDGSGTLFPLDGAGVTLPPALAVGETRTVTFDVVVDQPLAAGVTQIENEVTLATSYGTYVAVDVQPTAPPEPSVSLAKTVYRGHDAGASCQGPDAIVGRNGDAVTYCFVVTNDGSTPLAPVTVTDADLGIDEGDLTVLSGSLASLVSGASATLYYESAIDGDLTNTASVSGQPVDGGGVPLPGVDPVEDDDTAQVDEVAPAVVVAKTVYRGHDAGALCEGAESVTGAGGAAVTYCFVVTNEGDTTLAPVTVSDADLGIDEGDLTVLSGSLASLASGASATLYYESAIDGDLTNTASVSGVPVDGGGVPLPGVDPVEDSDTAQVDEVAPAVSVAKTVYRDHDAGAGCTGAEQVSGLNGDAVTYCFVVTNEGDTTLAPVTVSDADLGIDQGDLTVLSGSLASLASGASATLYYETVLDGDLTNTASVSGVPVDGSGAQIPGLKPVTGHDTARVDAVGPAVVLAKTVYRGHDAGASCQGDETLAGRNGEAVTYCFVVTNNGDTPLAPVTVSDADLGVDQDDLTVLSGALASLAPGASATLFYESAIDGDLTNTATASGVPVDGSGDPLPGIGPVEDDDTAQVDEVAPAVVVAKTVYRGHDAGAGCPGGEVVRSTSGAAVTYCFVVTNDGDTTLAPVTVTDADLGVDQGDLTVLSGSLASLAPGVSTTLYVEATLDADLVNTASVSGVPVDDGGTPLAGVDPVTDDDTAEVDEVGPAVSVAKTVHAGQDAGAGCPGGELVRGASGAAVTYCFVVTNEGDTTLAPVTVSDADLGIDQGDLTVLSGSLASLAPGASATLYYGTLLDGDLVNTASVSGVPVDGGGDPIPGLAPVTDDDTAQVDEVTTSVVVAKTVYRGHDAGASCEGGESVTGPSGDAITYCFVVTNNGGATLAPVTVTDADLGIDQGDLTVLSGSLASLAPGASAALYVEATIDRDLTNTVSVTGTPVDDGGDPLPGGQPVEDSDTAQVDEVAPAVSVAKTVYAGHDAGAGCPGGDLVTDEPGRPVTWCFTVTNTGDTTLAGVTLDDGDLGVDEGDLTVLSGSLASLAPGGTVVLYLEGSVDGDLVNTATAAATPPVGPEVSDEDTAEVDEVNAALGLEKAVYLGHDAGAGCAAAGGSAADEAGRPVTWCFTVTNTGDATLAGVTLDDGDLGVDEGDLTVLSGSLASLAPGGTVVLYLEGSVDGDLVNTATAAATPPVGPEVSDEDTAEVDELVPGYTLAKTVYRGHDGGASCEGTESVIARAGDAVTWCVLVSNTGETALDVHVTDPDAGIDETIAGLAPGGSEVLFAESTVDGDLVNTASATGTTPGGEELPEDDTAEIDEVHPGLDVQKTVYAGQDGGAGCPGEDRLAGEDGRPLTWCFTVTNTGDTPLSDVTIDDPALLVDESDLTVVSGSLTSMDPGDTAVLYLEATLARDLVNTATATGVAPVGPDVSDVDDAEIEVLVPGVSIDKSVYRGHDGGASCEGGDRIVGQAGDQVTWCFLVTNTGEVTLDVSVDDPDVGFTDTVADLAPGDTATLWFEGTVDGDLVNTATATGDTPDGDEVTDEDDAEVEEIHPSIHVEKTVYLGHDDGSSCDGVESVEAELGDAATWCFEVTNTGDVDLVDLDLLDPVLGIDEGDVTLLNGSLASLAPAGTIVAYYEGTVDGDILNTVTAGGIAPDESRQTDSDTAGVAVIGPQIGLAKTVVEGPTGNGDGTYTLTYRLRVANAGETRLDGVQVVDDLTETFDGAAGFTVDDVASADLAVNWPGYTGTPAGSLELLDGTDTLGVGDRGDIEVTVTVDPGSDLGPYRNTATATGASPGGEDVDDTSDSGHNADPTDPNPDEPGDSGGTDDPVPVAFPAIDLTVAKTVGDVRVDGTTGIVDWRIVVTNNGPGDDPGPITVTDEIVDELSFLSATGDGWECTDDGQLVTCVWDAPLAAGASTSEIQLLTELTVTADTDVTNDAHVASTGTETDTDNNDDAAEVTVDASGDDGPGDGTNDPGPTGTLPRTGAAIGSLLLLGLGLVLGGRSLQNRARRPMEQS